MKCKYCSKNMKQTFNLKVYSVGHVCPDCLKKLEKTDNEKT